VYLSPYPKSLVAQLYDDSIEINVPTPSTDKVHFHSFVGVTPRRYAEFFLSDKRVRKDSVGRPQLFDSANAKLTLPPYSPEPESVLVSETVLVDEFSSKLAHYQRQRRRIKAAAAARSGGRRGR
jgi:hypothetical protein